MPWRSRHTFILAVVAAVFAGSSSRTVISQVTQRQRPLSVTNNPLRPLPLAHLYWHFLAYQNHLDTKAAAIGATGKDGSKLRNALQHELGFSDADYAFIRTSSTRLTANVHVLDGQARTILSAGPSQAGRSQLQMLTFQRESDINAERSYLKANLSPAKMTALEAFLVRLFPPPHAAARGPLPATSAAPKGEQQ